MPRHPELLAPGQDPDSPGLSVERGTDPAGAAGVSERLRPDGGALPATCAADRRFR